LSVFYRHRRVFCEAPAISRPWAGRADPNKETGRLGGHDVSIAAVGAERSAPDKNP